MEDWIWILTTLVTALAIVREVQLDGARSMIVRQILAWYPRGLRDRDLVDLSYGTVPAHEIDIVLQRLDDAGYGIV